MQKPKDLDEPLSDVPTEEGIGEEPAPLIPYHPRGPQRYTVTVKGHFAAHKPWREIGRTYTHTMAASEPDVIWQALMRDLMQMLGFGSDDRLIVGLILNMVNSFPDHFRESLTLGIIEGLGLVLIPDEKGETVAELKPLFVSLAKEGPRHTPGGLILPD